MFNLEGKIVDDKGFSTENGASTFEHFCDISILNCK